MTAMRRLRGLLVPVGAALLWSLVVVAGALRGWWLAPIAPAGDAQAFFDAAAARVDAASPGSVALAILEDGTLRRTHFRGVDREIDAQTLFPVASLGKWVTAYGVLRLAQDGRIDLDAPVSGYLERWPLTAVPGFDAGDVTVRHLLSHTAGLTDGLGFADLDAARPAPDLLDVLAHPLASDGTVADLRVHARPGSTWAYSGGSYLVLELLVEDVTGSDFAEYMRQEVFEPIGMERSTYAPLSTHTRTSGSWTRDGAPAPEYRYASAAATGLATTVSDLARFAGALHRGAPLSAESAAAMRAPLGHVLGQPIWGAGAMLYADDGAGDFVYGHDGANDPSINATLRLDPASGDGIVVLSTGPDLLASVLGYEWVLWRRGRPDFLHTGRALRSALAPLLVGLALILAAAAAHACVRRRAVAFT